MNKTQEIATDWVKVYVTPTEKKWVERESKRQQLSISRFLREMILERKGNPNG